MAIPDKLSVNPLWQINNSLFGQRISAGLGTDLRCLGLSRVNKGSKRRLEIVSFHSVLATLYLLYLGKPS